MAEIFHSHVLPKEINNASSHSNNFNENVYCKSSLRVFSAIKGPMAEYTTAMFFALARHSRQTAYR